MGASHASRSVRNLAVIAELKGRPVITYIHPFTWSSAGSAGSGAESVVTCEGHLVGGGQEVGVVANR